MKKLLGAATLGALSVAGAGVAHADGTFVANVGFTSDYVFRGISLSDNGPAIQGGADYVASSYYAGVWGSSVSDGLELDVYAGLTPETGPVAWDLGFIAYFYPGANDGAAEFDYVELKVAGELALTERLSAGGSVYWSGDNWGGTGEATYIELTGRYAISDAFAFSAAFGNQTIEDPDGPLAATSEDAYNTWNLGAAYAIHGFQLDFRYHDTDIEAGSDIEAYTYGPASYDSAFVFTIGREL